MFFSVINGQSFFSESPTKLIPGHFIFSSNSFIQDAYDDEAPPELDFSEDYGLDEYREFAEQRGQRIGTMNIYVADHLELKRLLDFGFVSLGGQTNIDDFPRWLQDNDSAFTSVLIKVKPLQSLLIMNSTETHSFIGAYKDLIGREPENSAILGLNATPDSNQQRSVVFKVIVKFLEVKSDGEVSIFGHDFPLADAPGLYVKQNVEFTGQFFGKFATVIGNDTSRINFTPDTSDGFPFPSTEDQTFTSGSFSVPANAIAFVSAQVSVKFVDSVTSITGDDVSAKIEMYDSDDENTKSISYIDSDSRYMKHLSVSPFVILTNTTNLDAPNKTVTIKISTVQKDLSVDGKYKLFISHLTGISYKATAITQ